MSAQASPRIFQRKQGGWNAKLPEVDLDNHRTSVASTQDSSRNSQGREISLKPGNEGATSIYMSFEPTWTAQRTSNKRELVFVVVNTNDPAYKIESQSGDAHDSHLLNGRAQSHTTQGSRFTKAIRWGSDDHYRVEFEPASLVRDEFRELEVSRRVIWQHSVPKDMSINNFISAVNECTAQGLSKSEFGLINRLMNRLRIISERPFVGGRYLMPLALRYDSQDVSKYTAEKTCVFFSFPYMCLDTVDLRKYYDGNSVGHPPRTLLQSRYRLNKTEDRDSLQCVKWLKPRRNTSRAVVSEPGMKELPRSQVEELFYVPQFWGLIVGSDTLITSGCHNRQTLCGSNIQLKRREGSNSPTKLALLQILFYHNGELEELIYPIHQCDSCFGLFNKKQRIQDFLAGERAPKSKSKSQREKIRNKKAEPDQQHLWRNDDGRQITFDNWGSILEESRGKEMLSLRMQIDPPEISVKTLEAVNPGIGGASEQQGPGALHTSISGLKAPAFLEWPMRDEFGEEETVSTKYRVSMFLRAIYLGLPVPNDMKRKERPRYPQGFSERRAQAKQPFVIQPTTFAYLQKHIGRFKLGPLGQDLLSRAQELMHLFIPFLDGVDIDSHATSILWGAVSEILREAAWNAAFETQLPAFIDQLNAIISSATYVHRGVHCSRSTQVPGNFEWRHEDTMADGAVLLSAIVDALCSIFHMFIEAVRQIRPIRGTQMVGFMATSSEVVQHASKAVSFLNVARDQLIREVDGRDDNDTIGPVLTPQAITITVIERLVSGVYHSGTLDIIGLYEECLEHLTLEVKHEASRRLLQKINEFSEEVAIVGDVLKQQNNVLLQLRSSLDPTSFSAPNLARKLRFEYERKSIDKILMKIKEDLRAYAELRDRAIQLSTENVRLVETLQDDNSKAIFIFTIVTVLFLPLSFVARFFGMNLQGISDTTSGVRHFWEISLPLTGGIVILCAVVAIKGEDTYFASTRAWRYGRKLVFYGR